MKVKFEVGTVQFHHSLDSSYLWTPAVANNNCCDYLSVGNLDLERPAGEQLSETYLQQVPCTCLPITR